ncbi:MAG TPA: ABC transporter permease [Nitrososphaerales archaeon]|nr:ABC transporter permease [Nitrososphaerales archaeon]
MAIANTAKVMAQGAWIGWKVESNWTDPFVFLAYMIAKPMASVIMIGLIFLIGSDAAGTMNQQFFFYTFTGAIFFIYPTTLAISLGYLMHEDRAKYEVLKQIYIAPESIKPYIFGRVIASSVNATVSVIAAFVIGTVIFSTFFGLDLGINALQVNYPLLVGTILLGIIAFGFLGLLLCAINLVSFKLQYSLSEYTTGFLFLLSGVVFPVSVLPTVAQEVGYALPTTYFLNLVRSSLLGSGEFTLDLAYMILSTAGFAVMATILFKIAEHRARQKGMIDRKAEY